MTVCFFFVSIESVCHALDKIYSITLVLCSTRFSVASREVDKCTIGHLIVRALFSTNAESVAKLENPLARFDIVLAAPDCVPFKHYHCCNGARSPVRKYSLKEGASHDLAWMSFGRSV